VLPASTEPTGINLTRISPTSIDAVPPRRHDGRVARQSVDPSRLHRLDRLVVAEQDAETAISVVCSSFSLPQPRIRFHARRSPFTGATERPRSVWIALLGETEVVRREANGWGSLPDKGTLRLGRRTTLMTVAHELGHHLVFCLEPPRTPAHGNVWVRRFDAAAITIDELVMKSMPGSI
jgi:hypothetical protein